MRHRQAISGTRHWPAHRGSLLDRIDWEVSRYAFTQAVFVRRSLARAAPAVCERLIAIGSEPRSGTAAELDTVLKSDVAKWKKIVEFAKKIVEFAKIKPG